MTKRHGPLRLKSGVFFFYYYRSDYTKQVLYDLVYQQCLYISYMTAGTKKNNLWKEIKEPVISKYLV